MKTLIYSDRVDFTRELLEAAALIGEAVVVVVNNESNAQQIAGMGSEVIHYRNEDVAIADTLVMAKVITEAAKQSEAEVILLGSDRRGKELAGRVSAMLGAGCLTDVNGISIEDGEIICQRNAFGGATVAKQTILTQYKVIAIAAKTFIGNFISGQGTIKELQFSAVPSVKVLSCTEKPKDTVDIGSADVIIAIGQGVEDQNRVADVEAIAAALGGVAACSKPVATDRKWFSEDRIIGLSGASCKPSLAILFGISGQVQFSVGIRDAKKVITINTDDQADMVRMSDYFLVADADETIQALKTALR